MFRTSVFSANMNKGAAMNASVCACSCTENKALLLTVDTVIAVSIFVIVKLIAIISLIIPESFIGEPKTVLVQ